MKQLKRSLVKTIAGKGSKISLRDAERLSKQHGGNPEDWSKRVGKIESDKYIFDIHWYKMVQRNCTK